MTLGVRAISTKDYRMKRILTIAAATVALTGGFAIPLSLTPAATAKSVTAADPVDPPARADITRVTYRNSESSAGATVHVRNLQRAGKLVVLLGPPGTDVMYQATVWIKADGTLGKRLAYTTDLSRVGRACGLTASWSAATDTIGVSVPHKCLTFGMFLSRHWIQATLTVGSARDAARGLNVGRGDSPDCVTTEEMKRVTKGTPKAGVHAQLDTAGRPGSGGAGGYSRVYRTCNGSPAWWIEYNGWTTKVLQKGRIGG